ncbi:PD-(D/E)XK nuclease superfamily protein [Planctomyces sp. SH-PL14]|nr:PD-(D/E)XK nuclease superfamily protein [Planctomyces sp. SH-PL14]
MELNLIDDIHVADRSDLETAYDCPQKFAYEQGQIRIPSRAAEVGNQGHAAISATIEAFIREGLSKRDIAEFLKREVLATRTDLLPDTWEAMWPSMWKIAELLSCHRPGDVERFDGGQGAYSGQLAKDISVGGETVRVTSELDLLLATVSEDVFLEVDWKTGHTPYDIDHIKKSFQFRLHAALVFDTYPACNVLRVQVLRTQYKDLSPPVKFHRDELPVLEAEIQGAAARWLDVKNRSKPDKPLITDRFATAEKCRRCQGARQCWKSRVETTPAELVDLLTIIEAVQDQVQDELKAICGKNGEVEGTCGQKFGTKKPKTERASYALY